jgi:hypothetical protein
MRPDQFDELAQHRKLASLGWGNGLVFHTLPSGSFTAPSRALFCLQLWDGCVCVPLPSSSIFHVPNRNRRLRWMGEGFAAKFQGHWNYYGVIGNSHSLQT